MSKKILIVEDEEALLRLLSDEIKKHGYEVVEAVDGVEALTKFKKEKPDLLLLEIVMPKKNGFEVLEEIRLKLKSKVPVIVISNLDQPDDVETGKRLGVTDYIVKSNISIRDLLIKIHQVLEV